MGEETTDSVQPEAVIEQPVVADTSPVPAVPKNWSGRITLWAGVGSILAALLGALGSGWELWHFSKGFLVLAIAFGLGAFALLFGLFVGWRQKKKGVAAPKLMRWSGMLLGVLLMGWLLSFAWAGRSVPAIHDISTDLADPPAFRALTLRPDNFDQIPGESDGAMKGMTPQQRWAVIHQGAYGDIRSVRINEPVAQVIAKAERLANARGWDVAAVEPAEGRLEATDTTRFFRFKDDVVIRVRSSENGAGSIVDMRSVSRVGMSDLGVNAKRVRAFLADLSGTVSAAP